MGCLGLDGVGLGWARLSCAALRTGAVARVGEWVGGLGLAVYCYLGEPGYHQLFLSTQLKMLSGK